jgi:TonB family protein
MKLLLKITTLLFCVSLYSQNNVLYKGENINELDANGNKIGIWKLFDEDNGVKIITDFSNQEFPITNFFKNEKLIATFDQNKRLEILKDNKIIKVDYFYKENGAQTLIYQNGKELEDELISYFSQVAFVKAMFYGGINELFSFIGNNFNNNGQNGSVKVKFVVDRNGSPTNIEVVESSNPKLNEEAIRVISISPRWQPTHQGGDFVNTPFMIPINIK